MHRSLRFVIPSFSTLARVIVLGLVLGASAATSVAAGLRARVSIHIEALDPGAQKLVELYGTQNGPIHGRVFFKAGASRTEMPANAGPGFAGQVIVATAAGQVHQIAPAAEAYLTWPRRTPEKAPRIEAQRSGKTQTIAGYACEQVIFQFGVETWEFWVTKDLPGLTALDVSDNTLDARRRAMYRQLGGVPIRSINTTATYRLTSDLTEIEPQALEDALFTIPAGYVQVKDAGDLMKRTSRAAPR